MYGWNWSATGVRADQTLAADVLKALQGEFNAITCYEKLGQAAPDAERRERITEIREDEMKHYRWFAELYISLTGRRPSLQEPPACPTGFQAGVSAAFRDEQETVDQYLDLAERVGDPVARERVRRAAADEQNHAVWFVSWMGR